MLRVFRREKIQIALHRVPNMLRVQGRNNEMPGFRSLEGRQCRLVIADLAHKNDIRRLTKRATQSGGKSASVTAHLSLGEITATVGELILHGVLDRHYVSHLVLVDPLKQGRDRCGFP